MRGRLGAGAPDVGGVGAVEVAAVQRLGQHRLDAGTVGENYQRDVRPAGERDLIEITAHIGEQLLGHVGARSADDDRQTARLGRAPGDLVPAGQGGIALVVPGGLVQFGAVAGWER